MYTAETEGAWKKKSKGRLAEELAGWKGEDGWCGGKAREIMSCSVCDLRSNKTQNRDLMGQKEKDGELEGRQRRMSAKEMEIRWDKVREHWENPRVSSILSVCQFPAVCSSLQQRDTARPIWEETSDGSSRGRTRTWCWDTRGDKRWSAFCQSGSRGDAGEELNNRHRYKIRRASWTDVQDSKLYADFCCILKIFSMMRAKIMNNTNARRRCTCEAPRIHLEVNLILVKQSELWHVSS